MTRLSVNVNKIALLRNARGGTRPDLARAARVCIEAGCAGITVHPRPDMRHIRPDDVLLLAELTRRAGVEFNIEGNPFAPPRGAYPGLLALCEQARPDQVTLVPDGDAQLTSDHGFAPGSDAARLRPLLTELSQSCGRISLFVDADPLELAPFAEAGAQRVELYTGPYAAAASAGAPKAALQACVATAARATAAGLAVNAGHDLDLGNLGALVEAIPSLAEVSIGHALIDDALYRGLGQTVEAYLDVLQRSRQA